MKALTVFTGKYGSSGMYANRLAEEFGDGSQAVDVKQAKKMDLDQWDGMIVGGGVYMGKTPRTLKSFLKKHLDELKNKKIGLFVCCASKAEDSQITEYFEKNFPSELVKKAVFKRVFPGGQVMNEKAGFFYKKMFDQMAKFSKEEIDELIRDTVNDFTK
ncbi:MAG: menaquinone-dependent protoporphyrinogen oxidase [Thermotogaceae bacterium]|jgi:menaquinone-dependent protoporphyrinogen oxidase|nr:menaquinone-dependent protoporphyrinogen oxidase [Thermotogaceae bacterium]